MERSNLLQEVSATTQGHTVLSSDLAILSTAANQLFESTSAMSTKACNALFLALREVSTTSLTLHQNPGNPRSVLLVKTNMRHRLLGLHECKMPQRAFAWLCQDFYYAGLEMPPEQTSGNSLHWQFISTKSVTNCQEMQCVTGCYFCRLFALGRMVDVLLYNLHRLHDLWPVFVEHVVEILGDPRPGIRSAILEALGKAIGGCLASVVPAANQNRSQVITGLQAV